MLVGCSQQGVFRRSEGGSYGTLTTDYGTCRQSSCTVHVIMVKTLVLVGCSQQGVFRRSEGGRCVTADSGTCRCRSCVVMVMMCPCLQAAVNVLLGILRRPEGAGTTGGKRKKKEGDMLLRPIICICNDQWVLQSGFNFDLLHLSIFKINVLISVFDSKFLCCLLQKPAVTFVLPGLPLVPVDSSGGVSYRIRYASLDTGLALYRCTTVMQSWFCKGCPTGL